MRHQNRKAHLNRTASHRRALNGNMSASLFLHRKIATTLAKAKYIRQFAERMITFAKKGDVAARRHVIRFIRDKVAVQKLFDELGPHFKNRNGGYTRIIKLGPRRGDAAPMAILELVGFDDAVAETTKSAKPKKSRLQPTKKETVKVESEVAVEAVEPDVVEETEVSEAPEPATESEEKKDKAE